MLLTSLVVLVVYLQAIQVQLSCERGTKITNVVHFCVLGRFLWQNRYACWDVSQQVLLLSVACFCRIILKLLINIHKLLPATLSRLDLHVHQTDFFGKGWGAASLAKLFTILASAQNCRYASLCVTKSCIVLLLHCIQRKHNYYGE